MAQAADASSRLCDLAKEAGSLVAWRTEALQLIAERIRYDGALFHELSPRVPLDRAALVGIDRDAVERTRVHWDELAVALGRLRDLAVRNGGVVGTDEAFPAGSRGRATWNAHVGEPLRAREALMAHLSIESRIVSAVLLVRRSAFTKSERDALREIVPALAVGDALRQLVETRELRGLVAEVRCVDQRLTPRQRELVELVALGRTDAEIASALAISANTVRNQLVAVRRRLGAANRAELVRAAVLR